VTFFGNVVTGTGEATTGGTRRWVAGTESTTNSSVPSSPGKKTGQLTLDNHILASLLVPLAVATDFVSKAVALMTEGLTMLAHWVTIHSAALDEHRLIGNSGRECRGSHLRKSPPPDASLALSPMPPCQARARHNRPAEPWEGVAWV